MKQLCIFLLLLFCKQKLSAQNTFKAGIWRGVLILSENKNELILPFNFKVSYINTKPLIEIINAEERIKVNEISLMRDSLNFKMPVFDSEFKTLLKNDTLRGFWFNNSKNQKIAFEAYYGDKNRFVTSKKMALDFSGKYDVTFSPNTKEAYKSIGIFKQTGNKITGTFLTETGDYRYLEGSVQNNNMAMSCFDGSHAFLFFANSAKKSGKADSLEGNVFYGISGSETWAAFRKEEVKLKDPESITFLKTPNEKINFSFPNLNNKTVSLNDEKFKNKVIIVQIMGSWCPNCMDETAYLAKLYKQYKGKGLEIISLAYERTSDFEKAKNNVLRLKERYGVEYELLITGLVGKQKASESLSFLNSITAFPTTIILDKNHNVKSIYTGFSGPATGKEYEAYKSKTEVLINSLLKSK